MSIIVPAGNKNVAWSPKEEKEMVKTASAAPEVKEEVNPLYEAAKKFAASSASTSAKSDDASACKSDKKDGVCPHCKGVKPCTCPPEEAPKAEETAVIEVGDSASTGVSDVVAPAGETVTIEVSKETAKELKDAIPAEEEAEIEIAISDDTSSIPGTDVAQSEIVKESNPGEVCACATAEKDVKEAAKQSSSDTKGSSDAKSDAASSDAKSDKASSDKKAETEVGMDKSASAEEFIKVAKLTPSNRKKLADYWVNMLGFPKDYVGLMVKDYEK